MTKTEHQVEEDLPELRRKSKVARDRSEKVANKYLRTVGGIDLAEIVPAIKIAREKAGLTLAQVSQATGLTVANLSKLENGLQDNPTLRTLRRYAAAVGKRLVVELEDL